MMNDEATVNYSIFYIFLGVFLVCSLAIGITIFRATTEHELPHSAMTTPETGHSNKLPGIGDTQKKTTDSFSGNRSGQRTLSEYYSRRVFSGSPPFIPHEIEKSIQSENNCLSCHQESAWIPAYNRYSPQTPHPDMSSCMQCHVQQQQNTIFRPNHFQGGSSPILGRSSLPGSPPPIPHDLHMREVCIPCHAGLGAVMEIQVEHPQRLQCTQCHLPAVTTIPFNRPEQDNL